MNSDEERNWENFLLEVAAKRQEHGMTHKDLADNAGTVERTISRLLSEPTKNPSLFLVASICQALHISLDKHFVKEVYNKTDSQNSEEMIEVLKEQVRQRLGDGRRGHGKALLGIVRTEHNHYQV